MAATAQTTNRSKIRGRTTPALTIHRPMTEGVQLSDRYACHPEAGGLGIYLVLWFGPEMRGGRRRPAAPGGATVDGPEYLETELRSLIMSAGLPLRVVVLDVSQR